MSSGPLALCGWNIPQKLVYPLHSMLIVAILAYGQNSIFGMLLGSSSVKTLENCWLSISAFVLESFFRSPSLLRVASYCCHIFLHVHTNGNTADLGIQLLGISILSHGVPIVRVVSFSALTLGGLL